MVKAIIFDWDGVIADSLEIQYKWFKHCCQHFNKNFPFSSIEELKKNYSEPFPEMYKSFGFEWERERKEMDKVFHEFMDKQEIPMKDGMKEIISTLDKSGYHLAIVSSNKGRVIKSGLQEYGIESHFKSVIAQPDKDENLKPDPKTLQNCMEKLNVVPGQTLYIGDQPSDIKTAKFAEAKSMAVTWGYCNKERLKKKNPDYIVSKPKEITQIVKN